MKNRKAYSIIDINKSIKDNKPVNPERVKGAMIYNHKTGGSLQVMSQKQHQESKKHGSRKGQSSTLRNVLVANGRLQ